MSNGEREEARPQRDVKGALGGSRWLQRPEVAGDVEAFLGAMGKGKTLLEIGFDHGRRLSATASENPTWTVIGLEVREKQVEAMRAWAQEHALPNLHAFRLDGRMMLANVVPQASLDVIEALFPTPWPEGKMRRRLLVEPLFLEDVERALKPGGLFHVATDVAWYAELIEESLGNSRLEKLEVMQAGPLRPPCSQKSRREWKCEREGLPIYRYWARKVGEVTTREA